MGRWAQRQRGGGGTALINSVVLATFVDGNHIRVTYASSVLATALSPGSFIYNPDADPFTAIAQFSPNALTLTYPAGLTAGETVTYSSPLAGFRSPQTFLIT